jgi:tRNA (guanine-N(7)-)-methyltransferase
MAIDFGFQNDIWKRAWWNRALSILDSPQYSAEIQNITSNVTDVLQKKYADKFLDMVAFKNALPDREYKEKWLEIGFGNGDNIVANARARNHILFMGSEIHQPGIGALSQKIEQGLETDNSIENIRILPGDGIKLLSHLPDNYLDAILITFPDPWPRDIHARWRVIQTETIHQMTRVLSADGRVFIATDVECFDSWTREIFTKGNSNEAYKEVKLTKEVLRVWKEIIPCPAREEWLPVVSYYEQKGINEGRHTMLQCWKLSQLQPS